MATPPRWALTGLRYLVVVVLLVLVGQYLLGLYTNVYGVGLTPSGSYTSESSGPALDWHHNFGYLLGVLAVLTLIFAALARRGRLIGQSAALLLWIAVAGIAGNRFVSGTPNAPFDSFVMGLAFLLAFGTVMGMFFSTFRMPGMAGHDRSPGPSSG